MSKKDLLLYESLKPIMKRVIVKKITSTLFISATGPIGYVIGLAVNLLMDSLLKPVWEKLREIGLFQYDIIRTRHINKKIEEAKTEEERIESFNNLP